MIAYLLLVHSNPKHLKRLITRLRSDGVKFFIHVDKKADFEQFADLRADDVTFVDSPVSVYWGDFSQVEAILLLMKAAVDAGGSERLVLLSGVDYPLLATPEINAFFARHPTDEFINMVEMPSKAAQKSLTRLTNYRVRSDLPRLHRLALRLLLKVRLMPRHRDFKVALGDLVPYGGSTWLALTRPACEYILDFVQRKPAVADFFRNTECPDESFIHTILGNSSFRQHVRRNFTYTDWSKGGASPSNISEAHLPYFQANSTFGDDGIYGDGPLIFARKFSDADGALLAKLDEQIALQGPTQQRLA